MVVQGGFTRQRVDLRLSAELGIDHFDPQVPGAGRAGNWNAPPFVIPTGVDAVRGCLVGAYGRTLPIDTGSEAPRLLPQWK
jgi:hypothetical protein